MNFTYVVSKPPDGTFGALKPDGNWTGMIGELVNQKADIGKVLKRYTIYIVSTGIKGISLFLLLQTQ